jgi:hypothetical protein
VYKIELVANAICLLFFSCSCHREVRGNSLINDTVPKEIKIPYHDIASVDDTGQLLLQKTAKYLGLSSLVNGRQGLTVRIWLWDLHQVHYVVNIYESKNEHRCSVIQWTGQQSKTDTNDYIFTVHSEWSNLQPKSGWDSFDSVLAKYQICGLAGGMDSKDMPDIITPAAYVDFEIAQRSKFRHYKYLEPSFYRYIDEGSNDVYQFLKYFDKQMSVEAYHPADSLYIHGKYRNSSK